MSRRFIYKIFKWIWVQIRSKYLQGIQTPRDEIKPKTRDAESDR